MFDLFRDLRRGPDDPIKFEAVDGAKFEISCHQGNRHAFARDAAKASAYAMG